MAVWETTAKQARARGLLIHPEMADDQVVCVPLPLGYQTIEEYDKGLLPFEGGHLVSSSPKTLSTEKLSAVVTPTSARAH